jgi:hypothetical protein
MTPQPRKKPVHELTELICEEVSLCDKPSNPGAWVALWKRDNGNDSTRDSGYLHRRIPIRKSKEEKMSFEKVLKAAQDLDQLAVQQVVEAPARIAKIMEERKCSEAIAKCFAWGREEQEAYELAKKSDISRLRAAVDDDDEDDEDQKVSAKVARKVAKLRKDNPSMDYSTAENQVLSSRPKLRAKYYAAVGVPMAGQPPKKRGSMVAA